MKETKRKRREDREMVPRRSGSFLLVTDGTKTEVNYLKGLLRSRGMDIKNIKFITDRTQNLLKTTKKTFQENPKYVSPWIILDRDQVVDFDEIIDKAQDEGINVAWSNPCIETWFSAYFGKFLPAMDSVICCSRFAELYKRKTGRKYFKNEEKIYEVLNQYGKEEEAIERARMRYREHIKNGYTKPSQMVPSTTMQELVSELKS